jgi:Phosphotransferase enzyme family
MPSGLANKRASVSEQAEMGTGHGIVRLDISSRAAATASCIAKVTSLREVAAHRLVDAALPRLAPKFFQAVALGDDDPARERYLLLMEDCNAKAPVRTLRELLSGRRTRRGAQMHLIAAIRQLAVLHRRFETCTAELERRGIGPALTGRVPGAQEVTSIIERALHLSRRSSRDKSLGAQCAVVSQQMSDFFARMQNKERHTLVHGDFHFDNILVREPEGPIVVDWGAAATANPCWDLVFCGLGELRTYLRATRTHARRQQDFLEDHRAAVAVRMLGLLQAALVLQRHRAAEVRLAVPIIIRNFARAASRPYRGGTGFRMAYVRRARKPIVAAA